jgi:hypothetical protein
MRTHFILKILVNSCNQVGKHRGRGFVFLAAINEPDTQLDASTVQD